jgi:hypothetical protein
LSSARPAAGSARPNADAERKSKMTPKEFFEFAKKHGARMALRPHPYEFHLYYDG